MNLTQLIERCRDKVADNSSIANAPKQWSDAQVVRELNSALFSIWNEAISLDENFGLSVSTAADLGMTFTAASLAGGILSARMPKTVGHLKYVEESVESGNFGKPVDPINFRQFSGFSPTPRFSNTPEDRGFLLGGDGVIHVTRRDTDPNESLMRVWYLKRPAPLMRFTATYVSSSAFSLNLISDVALGRLTLHTNHYSNTYVTAVANGASWAGLQDMEYLVAGSGVAVHPTFGMTIDAATPLPSGSGTATFETVPDWPEEHHEYISILASAQLLEKGSDRAGLVVLQEAARKKRAEFMTALENRQLVKAREVLFEEDV